MHPPPLAGHHDGLRGITALSKTIGGSGVVDPNAPIPFEMSQRPRAANRTYFSAHSAETLEFMGNRDRISGPLPPADAVT
jgi:hypothetical protein